MSYVENNLLPGETLIHHTKITSFVFVPRLAVAIMFAISLLFIADQYIFFGMEVLTFIVFLSTLPRLIYRLTSEYAITNKRVLGKIGFAAVRTVDILLPKVESVRIQQNLMGQFFNFGDVEVTGSGGTEETLPLVTSPSLFRNKLEEAITALPQAPGSPVHES